MIDSIAYTLSFNAEYMPFVSRPCDSFGRRSEKVNDSTLETERLIILISSQYVPLPRAQIQGSSNEIFLSENLYVP